MNRSYILKTFLFITLFSAITFAYEVDSVQVSGNKNVEKSVILEVFSVTEKTNISPDEINNNVKKLYKTGLFESVNVSYNDSVLEVKVVENPVLIDVSLNGNDNVIKKEQIDKIYTQIGLIRGKVLTKNSVFSAEKYLADLFKIQGYYNVKVSSKSVKLDSYRVNLEINIDSGKQTKISSIDIEGNHDFSRSQILDNMKLKTTGIFSYFFSDNLYSRYNFENDLAAIKSFYAGNGYLNFKIESDNVKFTDNNEKVAIKINISEGDRYKISGYSFKIADKINKEDLVPLLKIKKGDYFSRANIQKSSNAIVSYLADSGFAGAVLNVELGDFNADKHQVKVIFKVESGKVYTVNNISFTGNYLTDEVVLRRYMKQYEGQVYNKVNLDKSILRLRNLSFVKNATCTPVIVKDTDLVDLNCNITESLTSTLSGKVGFSDTEGLILGAGFSQNNFLGTGNSLSFDLNRTEVEDSLKINHSWPYFTENGLSVSTGLFYRKTTPNKLNISNYNTDNYGFNFGFGFPVAENHNLSSSVSFEHSTIKTFSSSPTQITDYVNTYGNEFNQINFGIRWSYKDLDRFIFPTTGNKTSLGLEIAPPYNDNNETLSYYKLIFKSSTYFPLMSVGELGDLVLLSSSYAGYGNGLGNQDGKLPWFKNFFAGGLGTVRGFVTNSLGPKGTLSDGATGKALGGNIVLSQSFDLIIPQNINEDMRFSLFVDAGNVFDDSVDWGDLRYSAGFSLQWRTAMAPLLFSFGFPLNLKPGDSKDTFAFSIAVGG
ncbi:MAG: outer membrane protein assembly factor BamA [Pseudomonadota bacterium]|nr:outer membrane protein assembly factor BamA [Pseudomonadota bacterium]